MNDYIYKFNSFVANELISLKTKDDLERIQTYLNFAVAKKDPYVWE